MNISLDFSEVADEFNLLANQSEILVKAGVDAVTQEVLRQWQIAVKQELHSTRNRYLQQLQVYEDGPLQNVIVLNPGDPLVNWLEEGIGAFDMKAGFQNSKKVKITKNGGWYLTIPFRQGTPDAVGEMFNGGIMPIDVYQMARNLVATTSQLGGGGNKGTSLTLPVGNASATPKTRAAVMNVQTGQTFAAYTHKSGMFDGMIRQEKTYNNATTSQYTTFRRVGSGSDPNSWIHKGIQAHNFAQKALDNTDVSTVQENAVDAVLTQMGY